MATIVGEALLAASLEVLVEKIVSGEFVDLFRSTKLHVALLDKLKITLLSLQAVLHDAEEKQIINPAVKQWLEMLRDAVFEADDLFDEINTNALRCKVESEYQTATDQVLKKLASPFKKFNRKINSKLQNLFERLEFLRQQNLGLKEGVSNWNVTPTSSVLGDVSSICGRDDDKMKLKEFLLSEEGSDGGSKIGVISIVGMGGLGKTTLAKLLYNDLEVKEKFEVRGWAHVSKDLDVVNLTKTLLESVTPGTVTASDLNKLQIQLQQSLSNKVYLLVLDDIWYGRYVGWNNLNDVFNVGKMGSKILITTRDERVALPMQAFVYIHHLRSMEPEDSWSLLAKHAFVASNNQQRSDLEQIGREIAKKCDGLPLAAVALGGLLRTKLSQDYWNNVLKSSIWDLTDNEVQPALLLSYRYLPSSLKGCFAYCSIFPKNSILEKKMIVQLWIAEGLVPQPKGEQSWEKEAEEYFDELVSRSLIRPRFVDDVEVHFEMHDLMNDLAMTVSSPYCIRLDKKEPHKRVRHLSYNKGSSDSYDKFERWHELKGLRTFLSLPLQVAQWRNYCMSSKLFFDLLSTMKQLHTLSLSSYYNITVLPKSIGNLIYLRYLNLSHTGIERLPSEICKLYNLQTLLLSYCSKLVELPKDMDKLVNLRHLDLRGTSLVELPVQISKLKNLHTLSDFIVSKQDIGLKIAYLGKLTHLQGNISISQLQNVTDSSHALQANLDRKKQIDELVLQWSGESPSNAQTQRVVFEQLCPSTNLKSLTIDGYGGNNFPNWLGGSLFSNMVYLRISKCNNCSRLPPLGQLGNLKELFIDNMKSIQSLGTEFYGNNGSPSIQSFPSLEILRFNDLQEWEEWKLIGGTSTEFPSLTSLSLERCLKLKGNIPDNLPSLTSLSLQRCLKLKGMTPKKLSSLVELDLRECPLLMESPDLNDNNNIIVTSPSLDVFSQLLVSLNCLREMTLSNTPSLMSFPIGGLPKTLQSLKLWNCENLEFLPCESLHYYKSLENLNISESCYSMTSFTSCFLPVLRTLFIQGCKNLQSILIAEETLQHNLLFLNSITISHCDELESVSLGGIPIPNLNHFTLSNCKKLRSLPPESMKNLASLQLMQIADLPNLQSFSIADFPISLRELWFGGNVGGILCNTTWECLTSLSELRIWQNDDILMALMNAHVPLLPSSLVSLEIEQLKDIESFDGKWLQHLTSLRRLDICYAPKLKSLPEAGKLPSSLKQLRIVGCPLLEASLLKKRGKEYHHIMVEIAGTTMKHGSRGVRIGI